MFILKLSEEPNWIRPELLLHPQIPWPLWGINPRRIMGKDWWDKTRKAAFAANNDCCWACGIYKLDIPGKRAFLEGHETYDVNYKERKSTYLETVGLCSPCHGYIHSGMSVYEGRDKIVLTHGHRILTLAGLERPLHIEITRPLKWRLIFNGKKYKGVLPCLDGWNPSMPPSLKDFSAVD